MAEECFQDIINLTAFSNDAIIQNNRPLRLESDFSVACAWRRQTSYCSKMSCARVKSLRKLPQRKKKYDRRRHDEGEKVFSGEPTRTRVAKFYRIVIPDY